MDTSLNKPINTGDTIIPWKKAMVAEAAGEMQFLKKLLLSRPYFARVQDSDLVVSDRGSTYIDKIIATSDKQGSYAMIYLPQNKPVTIDLSRISGSAKRVSWYDPRTGNWVLPSTIKGNGRQSFTPPGNGKDWILVIDGGGDVVKG